VTGQAVDQVRFGSNAADKPIKEDFISRMAKSIKKAWHRFLDFFTPTSKDAIEEKLEKLDEEMVCHLEKTNKRWEADLKKLDELAKKEGIGQSVSQTALNEAKSSLYKLALKANKVTISKQKRIIKLREKKERLHGLDIIQKIGLPFDKEASKEMPSSIEPKVLQDNIEQKYRDLVEQEKQRSRSK